MEGELKFAPWVNRKGCSVMGILFVFYEPLQLDSAEFTASAVNKLTIDN